MGHCNKTTCLLTPGAHVLLLQPSHLTDWRESHYRPLHLSDDSHCHMYKEVHKKQHVFSLRFTLLLSPNNMAQNKIKLHSKMGTEFPLEEEAKLLQRKRSQEQKLFLGKFHSACALGVRTKVCPPLVIGAAFWKGCTPTIANQTTSLS